MIRLFKLMAGLLLAVVSGMAATVEINNPEGDVTVVVTSDTRLLVHGMTPNGPAQSGDVRLARSGQDLHIEVLPRETDLDLTVNIPLGFALNVTTVEGDISLEGMVHLVGMQTDTGSIELKTALRGIRMTLDAEVAPPVFDNPGGGLFRATTIQLAAGKSIWRLRDRMDENAVAYGAYKIKSRAPTAVKLAVFEPPDDWPLRFHWEASQELQRTLDRSSSGGGSSSAVDELPTEVAEDAVLFRSDVRMVNLTLAVTGPRGAPAVGLSADDFHVMEAGVAQSIGAVQAGDSAFNLAIVLDMSGSAILDRPPLVAAARRFIEMARPGDRVAIYALTRGMFQVVSPLSSIRDDLLAAINNLPLIDGGSPLYDIVALSYAQELRQLPGERNALIVISDGLDNQVTGQGNPSAVKFKDLVRAAEEMHAMIYPVYLLSGERFGRSWSKRGRRRMQELADASGGRVFPAESIADLEPVFPLIEAELRSVYTLGYYPQNQEFDGAWRPVEVSVEKPDLRIRARPGYYAN